MSDADALQQALVRLATLQEAVSGLKESVEEDQRSRREDSKGLWAAITKTNETVSDLAQAVSTGRGAVRALAWVGGILLALSGTVATFISLFKD